MSRYLLFFNGAVLLGCAVFDFSIVDVEVLSRFDIRTPLLTALLLFLPFSDKRWSWPVKHAYPHQLQLWFGLFVVIVLMVLLGSTEVNLALSAVFLVALPEEWFFRAYFMQRMESILAGQWRANIATSLFFAMLHVPMQGWFGLTVFIPSMLFGYLYQRQKDLVLVVLLHALFNIVYLSYLVDYIPY